ncbi:membrane protein insertion efficiency factor YidD [Patescibacteria group bacterium]|nr:membrane protein insertion efficiency factor YidD [Patescibacteria group bacterium]
MIKFIVLKIIRFYQKIFSIDQGLLSFFYHGPGICKFQPTCSEYAYLAVKKYGVIRGGLKAAGRIFRCHPWSDGGNDKP